MTTVNIKQLENGNGLDLPKYETSGSAGVDLPAAEDMLIPAGTHAVVPTGLAIGLPEGFEAQVRPRSGLAAKHALTVLNTPGTIDSDYTGEVKVILMNHSSVSFNVKRGMRVAQMVIAPVTQVTWNEVDNLEETERGDGGLGSTGH